MEHNGYSEEIVSKENTLNTEIEDVAKPNIEAREQEKVTELSSDGSSNEGKSKTTRKQDLSKTLGTTGAAAAFVAVVLTVVITNLTVALSHFAVFGTYFDYKIETTIEYNLKDGKPVDVENFETGLRLITIGGASDFENVVELNTGNENVESHIELVNPTDKGGKINITFIGKVQGLTENSPYIMQIAGVDNEGKIKVHEEKKFVTTGPKTEFFAVETECKCSVDGNFYFKLNFVDENNYYSDFTYELLSKDGKKVEKKGDVLNLHTENAIKVSDVSGIDHILVVKFKSKAPVDVAASDTIKVIKTKVKI